MVDSIYPSLVELDNLDVLKTVDEVIENGTEADEQLSYEKVHGIEKLPYFLMDKVDYKY